MVERRTAARATLGAAAAATGTAGGADAPAESPPLSRGDQLLAQLVLALRLGGKGLQAGALAGVRTLLPLVEMYAARRAGTQEGDEQAGSTGLKRGEEAVLKAAVQKGFLQLLEITSRTHPVYDGAPPYVAVGADGQQQAPHLVHLLALAAAAREFFGDDAADAPDNGNPKDPGAAAIPAYQSVVFMAVAPGEYALQSGPLSPNEVRRNAMRQRSYTPPQPAMLASASNASRLTFAPAPAAAPAFDRAAAVAAAAAPAAARTSTTGGRLVSRCACGSGRSGSCSQCGGGGVDGRSFAPARYDADGSCASLTDISCDTRWRVRECLKVAFCDLLRCLGDELCQDNQFVTPKPDLGKCLETFVCSIVTCLPDAICPPPAPACSEPCGSEAAVAATRPFRAAAACDCNYAVGE